MAYEQYPYLINVYRGDGAEKVEFAKRIAECVVWALNSGNALLKVQAYYPSPQHSYIVFRANRLVFDGISIAELSDLIEESKNIL